MDVISALGSDHRGDVWRVRDKGSGDVSLLRIMEFTHALDTDALNRELDDIAGLTHPNVSFIRKVERIDATRIAVFMDDREGSWIQYHMAQLRENAEIFHQCVTQLCRGMEFIHQHGLCHWDIRPETILVHPTPSGFSVCFIETGLSYYLDIKRLPGHRDSRFHRAAMYMSPEIILGCGADYRSDLYSLGIVLFETATGINPFAASTTASVVSAQLNKNAPQAKEINDNVSAETNALILRLLAKESAFRPASASEVAMEISCDMFQPSIPPRTGGVFKAHPLPRQEIQKAFENVCAGRGSVITVYGAPGVGKTELLHDLQAEFELSGAVSQVIESNPEAPGGVKVLRRMIDILSSDYPGLNQEIVDTIYFLDSIENYLRLADRVHLDNILRHAAVRLLSQLFLASDELLDVPCVFFLRNCHFSDAIFWRFFQAISMLLSHAPERLCPFLWIIETHDVHAVPVVQPRPERHGLVEILAFDADETRSLLSAQLGLTPFPEEPSQWVQVLSDGLPRRICLIADVMRITRMVYWSEGDWIFNNNRFDDVRSFPDLDRLILWMFNEQLSEPDRVTLIHLAFWSQG
ncbi:protein kinase, partial [bacterium]|nr:protein kinase [candidate division CSSED10-310 bacterium]